jgi:serine/threonine protein kinase/DNA-binding SARP family transcriptional activator/predicted ATPase
LTIFRFISVTCAFPLFVKLQYNRPMPSLRIYLFGSPRVERNGRPVSLQRRKTVALLAYLARTNQPHSRDSLATLLWSEDDQAAARANLRRDLSRLREELGDDALLVDRAQVRLNPQAELWLDVATFEHSLEATRRHNHPAAQLCPHCLQTLTAAAELYQGDFMAGFSLPGSPEFDRWQFFQAESLRRSLAGALQQLAHWYTAQGQFEPAITFGRRWLALDPLHEPAHRQLMQLYAWSGQQAAALRQYQECVRLLQEELGVPPETATTGLHELIRTRQLPLPPGIQPTTPPPPEPAVETDPPDRYLIETFLTTGGHGEVYRGQDRLTGRPVVIKQVRLELLRSDRDYLARFAREGELLRQLDHPNIVKMLAMFEQNGRHSIVMEYAPGGTLRGLLERQPQLPLDQALNIALELADALSRAHHLNVIHRDLKPENVLLAADGSPRLTDFGMARLLRDDSQLTRSGLLMGSPAYMSPEALHGEELDPRSDIWSFGVLLYEMLAGRRPFDGEQITPVLVRILNEPMPDIGHFRTDLPPPLAELLRQMLIKERDGRLASMRLVAAQLEAIRDGRTLPATTLTPTSSIYNQVANLLTTPQQSPAHNLPPSATPFVGRQQELQEIQHLLLEQPASRLLTLVGPGGIGKTRLALAAAEAALPAFANGVFFVPLAPLATADHLLSTLAESIHFQFYGPVDPRQQLLNYLQPKQMLLVMDNFEHVLAGATLIADILQTAPTVKLLITSRQQLSLSGETIYALAGMAYPQWDTASAGWTKTEAAAYDAMRLLQQRAQLMRGDYPLQADEWAAMARICRLVQGMPLALLLASSWLSVLSFTEIADEIEQSLDFLEGEMLDLPERQRSMRAVFDYSWQQLSAEEQRIFMNLSVFRGGFTRPTAQAVAGANLRALRTLAAKSLLAVTRRSQGQGERYEIHELLRQFGAEALKKAGEAEATNGRHSDYYLALLRDREPDIKGRNQLAALREIEADLENIRIAWDWALAQSNLAALDHALECFHLFFDMSSRQAEGAALFAAAYGHFVAAGYDEMHPLPARLLTRACFLGMFFSDVTDSRLIETNLQRCLAVAQTQANPAEEALCLGALGNYYNLATREVEKALPLMEQSYNLFAAAGDNFFISRSLHWVGMCHFHRGAVGAFYEVTWRSVEISRQSGNKVDVAYSLGNLGEAALLQGDYQAAEKQLQEAAATAQELDLHVPITYVRMLHALFHCLLGDLSTGRDLITRAHRRAAEINYSILLAFVTGVRALLTALEGDNHLARQLGEEGLATTGNHGLGLILAHWAIALAACNRQTYTEARPAIRAALDEAHTGQYPAAQLWLLPVAAVVLAHQGEAERAVELLSLAQTHPLTLTGWLAHWPLLSECQSNLQTQLGPQPFEAAWDRGLSLPLQPTVEHLLNHLN